VPAKERPFSSASITRLRVLYQGCNGDAKLLEELGDELRRRRTPGAKQLLGAVEKKLEGIAAGQLNLMNGVADENSAANSGKN
jgi:hypothetical protein